MVEEYMGEGELADTFQRSLATLSNSALRTRYVKESRAHASIKRRVKEQGFVLDPAWDNFRDFLRDLGPAPSSEHTVDRIDPSDRTYGPGRCRWADKLTQTQNRLNTVWVEWKGDRITAAEFAKRIETPYTTVHSALQRGETPDEIAARIANRTGSGSYPDAPAWLPEGTLDAWHGHYRNWRRKVAGKRLPEATPELFTALMASLYYANSIKVARLKGVDEMTWDEHESARTTPFQCPVRATASSTLGWWLEMKEHGRSRIKAALRRLADVNAPLAVKLYSGPPEDIHLYSQVLMRGSQHYHPPQSENHDDEEDGFY